MNMNKPLNEVIADWVPDDAIRLWESDFTGGEVAIAFTYEGSLYILRFFPVRVNGNWHVSRDLIQSLESI